MQTQATLSRVVARAMSGGDVALQECQGVANSSDKGPPRARHLPGSTKEWVVMHYC